MFLVLISIVLVVAAMVWQVAYSVNILLYPGVYISAFENNDVYTEIENLLSLNESQGEGALLPDVGDIEITDLFANEGGIEYVVNDLLSNFLAYIRSDTDELDLTIELNTEVLRQFFEEFVQDFPICEEGQDPYLNGSLLDSLPECIPPGVDASGYMQAYLDSLPDCEIGQEPIVNDDLVCDPSFLTPDLIDQLVNALPTCGAEDEGGISLDEIPICRPPEQNSSEFLDQFLENNNISLEDFSEYNLANAFDGEIEQSLEDLRNYVSTFKFILYATLSAALAMMVLITVLNLKSVRSIFRWNGIDAMIAGLLIVLLSFVGGSALNSALDDSALPADFATSELSFVIPVVQEVANAVFGRMLTISLIILGIGIVFFVLSFFIYKMLPKLEGKNGEEPASAAKQGKSKNLKKKSQK